MAVDEEISNQRDYEFEDKKYRNSWFKNIEFYNFTIDMKIVDLH